MVDAEFEDGREIPLNIGALEVEDLQVLSSLVQDAIAPVAEMRWRPSSRQFVLLLNRFRWEDKEAAARRGGAYERVQSLLVIENVLGVASQGLDRSDKDLILSILSIAFEPGEDIDGHLLLMLAGDGALRLHVEALDVSLKDVSRPYLAPSGKAPDHGV